jgi:hypothetical protein
VKEDFEFILNLLKESALDFGAYLKVREILLSSILLFVETLPD